MLDLASILGGSLGDTVVKIIGLFKLSPDKAAELQEQVLQHAADLQKMQFDADAKLQDALTAEIQAASANIRAEASSGDKFTSRARPSFLYMMIGILGINYVVFPLIQKAPLNFPDSLFWLFGSCMLGYTGARTWEKIQAPGGAK